jgi:hypothetical protein
MASGKTTPFYRVPSLKSFAPIQRFAIESDRTKEQAKIDSPKIRYSLLKRIQIRQDAF